MPQLQPLSSGRIKFHFFFFLCGCALLGVGIYVCLKIIIYQELKEYREKLVSVNYAVGLAFFIIGPSIIVMAVGSSLICICAKQNKCRQFLLGKLFFWMVWVFTLVVLGIIMGFLYRSKVKAVLLRDMNGVFNITDKYSWGLFGGIFHSLQEDEKCCGVNSYKDWGRIVPDSCCNGKKPDYILKWEKCCEDMDSFKNIYRKCGCYDRTDKYTPFNITVLDTCCEGMTRVHYYLWINWKCGDTSLTTKYIYTDGCYKKLYSLLRDNVLILCVLGIFVAILTFLDLIMIMDEMRKKNDQNAPPQNAVI